MKPRTKLQAHICNINKSVSNISTAQEKWSKKALFKVVAYKTKKNIVCMECGNVIYTDTCPFCKNKVTIINTRKLKDIESDYFSIITIHKNIQLVRTFYIEKYICKYKPAHYFIIEVQRNWITENGNVIIISKLINYSDVYFRLNSSLELRKTKSKYLSFLNRNIYPRIKCIPIIRRNGYNNNNYNLNITVLFHYLITNNKYETLYKSNNEYFIKNINNNIKLLNKYYKQILLAIKYKYIPSDFQIWIDHIQLLSRLNKDIYSPHYLFPANLNEEHEYYIKYYKRKEDKKKRIMKYEYNSIYIKEKSKYFNINLIQDDIVIYPLKSIKEFEEEGNRMNHCIFTNDYFRKSDSLILTSKLNNVPLETIEYSLSKRKVIQAYGINNTITKYHNTIINIINNNKHLFK